MPATVSQHTLQGRLFRTTQEWYGAQGKRWVGPRKNGCSLEILQGRDEGETG